MSREYHNKAGYVVALVSEFATKYRIPPPVRRMPI